MLYGCRGNAHPHAHDPSSSSPHAQSKFLSLRPLSSLFPPFPCPLPRLSVAKALCVKTVAAQALKMFQEHPIFSEVISDQEAVAAIERFVGMCPVLARPYPLVQELRGCPGHLVHHRLPSLQV